jgi:hypothetical protein
LILSETKTTYQLANIRTGVKISGGTAGNLKNMKSWFEPPTDEPPTEGEIDTAEDTPEPEGDYNLRTPLPSADTVWERCGMVDRYTGHDREWYRAHQSSTDIDHMLEVQSANRTMLLQFPFLHGQPDSRAEGVVECAREYLRDLDNLNNTESGLNRWWKGVAVKDWHKRYHIAHLTGRPLRAEHDGLASVLRDCMKSVTQKMREMETANVAAVRTHPATRTSTSTSIYPATATSTITSNTLNAASATADPKVHWLESSHVFKGTPLDLVIDSTGPQTAFSVLDFAPAASQGAVAAPNYARRVCGEMGRSCFRLVDALDGRDGEAFLQYADALKDMAKAMDLPGSS